MASAKKPEAFVWIDNEVELLLRLTLDNKVSKLQETQTQAVVRHCFCCCYEMSQGSEVGGKRSRGGAMVSSFRKVCGFAVHMRMGGLRFRIFPPWDPFSKKCVFSRCIFRIRVDGRPKRCNTCVFSHENAKERYRVDDLQDDGAGLQGHQQYCTHLPPNTGQTACPSVSTSLYNISWPVGR